MKHLTALAAVVLSASLFACGGGVKLPPVEPQDVEVFMPGQPPGENYEVLGRLQEEVSLDTPDQRLIDRARAEAAEMGADALVITAIRRTTEGQIETNLGQEQMKIIEALAVYFPSRHPELQEQSQ